MAPSTRTRAKTPAQAPTASSTAIPSPTTTATPRQRSTRSRSRRTTTQSDSDPDTVLVSTVASSRSSPSTSQGTSTPVEESFKPRTESSGGMLSSVSEKALRGRAMEDPAVLEEEGLMRRQASDERDQYGMHRRGSPKQGSISSVPYSDKGKERADLYSTPAPEDAAEGLNNPRDRHAFALLIFLYLLQGIPLGLTFGTLPFLLKPHLSYSQLAVFALSTWPYSLKLLWSPIVDAWFVPKWGRRKSWIVPVQAIVGLGMWIIGGRVESWLEADEVDVRWITAVFGSLIVAAATQDIAVDGWALTLLSPANLSYASTAQTIGLGIGNALSFTVFLAFNSVDFSNKYFRSEALPYGLVSLGGFLRFWALVFVGFTVWLALYIKEDSAGENDPDMDIKKVYKVMWSIVRLKNIQSLLLILLICKIGFQVNESVTSLKLLEKGLSREDMAVAVLLDFPAQMIAGWLAAKWSRPAPPSSNRHPLSGSGSGAHPQSAISQVLRPWIYAFWARLVMAGVAATVVALFPSTGVSSGYFSLVVATTLLSSLASTVQFVGITAFFTQIADPLIGGTYMTLLNTVSNLGGTWPKPLILRSVDLLTESHCAAGKAYTRHPYGGECMSEHGKNACAAANGTCVVDRDGYYIMSAVCVVAGAGLLVAYILPSVKRLGGLSMSAWRVKIPT